MAAASDPSRSSLGSIFADRQTCSLEVGEDSSRPRRRHDTENACEQFSAKRMISSTVIPSFDNNMVSQYADEECSLCNAKTEEVKFD